MASASHEEWRIESPESPRLAELRQRLADARNGTEELEWPAKGLAWCGKYGVYEWFAGKSVGGQEWTERDLVRGYLALSQGCLTTAFIITQRTGACQRIERSGNERLKERLLPGLISGDSFATVGISHLTTSRRHLGQPALRATPTPRGFLLEGFSPWITGADRAEHLVVGATCDDGQQILVAVPTDLPGVVVAPPESLVALTGSRTGRVDFNRVELTAEWLLAGPCWEVMKQGLGARTGGLQTSTLAFGLARSAIDYLLAESVSRAPLQPAAKALLDEWQEGVAALERSADNLPSCSDAELRAQANSLVLRATQAALTAAKGTGYVTGHPTGRWCREALFFLVWSCPPPVQDANLCEFAGLEEPNAMR